MARRSPARVALLALLALPGAVGATSSAAPRSVDALEPVKTAIRLKKFSEAAGDLQTLAAAGNPDAQYLLAVFYLNGLSGPKGVGQARRWVEEPENRGKVRDAFRIGTPPANREPKTSSSRCSTHTFTIREISY